jgi:hypothetical protein
VQLNLPLQKSSRLTRAPSTPMVVFNIGDVVINVGLADQRLSSFTMNDSERCRVFTVPDLTSALTSSLMSEFRCNFTKNNYGIL